MVRARGSCAPRCRTLQATQRLRRLAEKHEDARLAQGLAEDEAYMTDVVATYTPRASRYLTQWCRYWRALGERVEADGA